MIPVKPGKGSLDHLATGQEFKSFDVFAAKHHIKNELKPKRNPVQELTPVAPVNPDFPDFLARAREGRKQQLGAIAILHGCCGNDHAYQQSQCARQDVALAALNMFACVVGGINACISLQRLSFRSVG